MIVMHITWEHLWVYFGAMRGDTQIQPQSIISTFRNLCMSSHKSNMPVVNFTLGVRVFVCIFSGIQFLKVIIYTGYCDKPNGFKMHITFAAQI